MLDKSANAKKSLTGTGLVFLSSFFYGTYGVWNRLLGPEVGAFSQAALRCALVVLLVLPLLIKSRQLKLPEWKRDGKWMLLMAAGGIFSQSANFMAINRLGIGLAVTTMFTVYVLVLMIWGSIYDKLPFTHANLMSLLVAVVGLGLMFNPFGGNLNVVGLLLAVVGGLAISATIIGGKYLSGGPLYAVFMNWGLGAVVTTAVALAIHEHPGGLFTASKLGIIIIFALVSLAASFTVQSGVRMISAALTGLIGLLENVFALAFGALFFGERIGWLGILGAGLILVAIAIPDLQALSNKRKIQTVQPGL